MRKGSHHSEETRAKMRMVRREISTEARAKMGASWRGRKRPARSAEHRARLSAANKGNQNRKGKPQSAGTRAKISDARRGMKFSAEHRANIAAARRGRKASAETKAKISAAGKGRKMSPEHRAKMSAFLKERWLNDETYRSRALHAERPTILERVLLAYIKGRYPRRHVKQEYKIGTYSADVAIPTLKLIFEADGDRWHNLPGRREADRRRDKWLSDQGWTVERFTERRLRDMAS